MISDFEETIKESTRHMRLSEEEKNHIRMRLVGFIHMKPASLEIFSSDERAKEKGHLAGFWEFLTGFVRNSVPSRLTERSNKNVTSTILFNYMPIILGLFLLISGGMSFAAEGSLPGDVLYPIKVHVNERVRGTFSFSPKTKAEWEAKRGERRLDEVEQLAVNGRLSAETQAQIMTDLAASASLVDKHLTELQTKGDAGIAALVSADIESSLGSHKKILSILAENKKEVRAQLQAIAVHVRKESERMSQVRVNIEEHAAKDEHARAATEGKLKAAEHKLNEVLIFIDKVDSLDIEARAKIKAQTEAAQSAIAEAKVKIDAGAYEEAFRLLQHAMQTAQDAKQFAYAHVHLNLSLDAGILDIRLKIESKADSSTEIENKDGKEENNDDKEEAKNSKREERNDHKERIESRIETETRIRVDGPLPF